jgi:hypothetical protein
VLAAGVEPIVGKRVKRPRRNLPLPPACPEFNSAEIIWQYLRRTCLANRVFAEYNAILDAAGTPGANYSPRPGGSP